MKCYAFLLLMGALNLSLARARALSLSLSLSRFSRFLAHGIKETFANTWNIFDAVIILMSLGLQIFKVIGDFVLIKAPYPPVVKTADYPTECAAFAAENKRNTSAMAIRNAATAGRLISRFFVGLRLMGTFIKVAGKRRHERYLQTATMWELCGGGRLDDVEFRLSQRPWEIWPVSSALCCYE